MHGAGDAVPGQLRAEPFAVGRRNREEMEYVIALRRRRDGRLDGRTVLEGLAQRGAEPATLGVPSVEPGELDTQHCGLERMEAPGPARQPVVIAGPLAVGAEQPEAVGEQRVIRDHGAAVAPPPEVLRG